MSNRIPGPQDAQLKLAPAATKTATFTGDALDLGDGYAPGFGGKPFQAVVPIVAADFSSANETYDFKLQHSADGSAWTDCGVNRRVAASDVGGALSVSGFVEARYVRLVLTAGGTSPSVQYGDVFLSPFVNA